jgi:hypothetical protein
MGHLRLVAALGVLLPALVVCADPPEAPLQSTRQELRKLEESQKSGVAPSARDGLRTDLPSIQAPGQEVLPFSQITAAERIEKEREKKQEAQKNWLVNGVNRLTKASSTDLANGPKGADESVSTLAEGTTTDSADPQYLLKMFDEQGKGKETRQTDAKTRSLAVANPIEPFLQGWLGNSPARGQFFDEFAGKSGAGSGPGTGTGPSATADFRGSVGFEQASPHSPVSVTQEQRTNPYLAAQTPIGLPELEQSSRNSAPSGLPGTGLTPVPMAQPIIPVVTPTPAPPAPERKPPPAPWAEEKKYFPQLKKF